MIQSPFVRSFTCTRICFVSFVWASAQAPPIFAGCPAPTITSANQATFTIGKSENFAVTTTGGEPPILLFCNPNFPAGVTFDDNGDGTASLHGTPQAGTAGTYALTIEADSCDGNGGATQQNFTLTVIQTCAPPPPNMIAWWRGDGNADDSVGGHHGSLMAGATFGAGEVGQGFSFNGVGAFVSVPGPVGNFGTGDF